MTNKKKALRDQIESESVSTPVKKSESKRRRKSIVMDLRIHSPASLGYLGIEGIDTAPAMVRLAQVKGLDVIAVTDFLSGDFVDEVVEAARESKLTVIPGVVIRCTLGLCDDVNLSCLFPEEFGRAGIEEFLLKLGVPRDQFGDKRCIVTMPFAEVLEAIEASGGAALPSRMDKTPYRQIALPSLVEEWGFRAFDLAYSDSKNLFKQKWPKFKFQLFSFSNANALAQVGSRIARVKMPDARFMSVRNLVAREQVEAASANNA